jgi:hypothetical protein
VLLQSGSTEVASMVDIYVQSLQRLGMQVTVEQSTPPSTRSAPTPTTST